MSQRTILINKEESQHKDIIKKTAAYPYSFGIFFTHKMNRWLGIDYGVCTGRYDQNFKIYSYEGATEASLKGRNRISYAKIPILLRGEIRLNDKSKIFVSTGPQLSILTSEDGVIPVYYGDRGMASDTLYAYDIAEAAGAYRKFTFDGVGLLGWKRKLYGNLFFELQVKVDYSLTDIENKSYSSVHKGNVYHDVYYIYSKDRPSTHKFALGIGAGLSMKFR